MQFKRRWFVVRDDAANVLPELFAKRKPVRDATREALGYETARSEESKLA